MAVNFTIYLSFVFSDGEKSPQEKTLEPAVCGVSTSGVPLGEDPDHVISSPPRIDAVTCPYQALSRGTYSPMNPVDVSYRRWDLLHSESALSRSRSAVCFWSITASPKQTIAPQLSSPTSMDFVFRRPCRAVASRPILLK